MTVMSHPATTTVDVLTVASIIATLAGLLPPLAALLACIWYTVLIYDRIKKSLAEDKSTSAPKE